MLETELWINVLSWNNLIAIFAHVIKISALGGSSHILKKHSPKKYVYMQGQIFFFFTYSHIISHNSFLIEVCINFACPILVFINEVSF